ncbi:MAG: hypothetical protein SOV73_09675 [Candidatus Faecivivens sp.]|nr:hypothetical protein [Candidatus Faecivivens sp.]
MVDIRPVSPYNAFNEQRRSSEGGVYPVGAPISDERLFFSLQKRNFFLSSKEKLFSLFKREKARRKRSFFIRSVWGEKKRFLIKAVKI